MGRSFEGTKNCQLPDGDKIEVLLYSRKTDLLLGQLTLLNTIIINKSLFERYSKTVQNYVLFHEYGHKKIHPLFSILLVLLLIPALLSLLAIVPTVLLLAHSILTSNLQQISALTFLLAGELIAIGLFMSACWLNELLAEFYAFKKLGLENVKQAWAEIKQKHLKQNFLSELFGKILIRLTHPPHWLTLKTYASVSKTKKA